MGKTNVSIVLSNRASALDQGLKRPLTASSSCFLKLSMVHYSDKEARRLTENLIATNALKPEKKEKAKKSHPAH